MLDLSNPFPGLRCFLCEEDYLFFGRHEQIEDLLRRLRTNRLVAVVGTSGSGKSSLVRAGLLPAVLGGGMAQAGSAWEIAVMRPGGSPMAHLARALCDAGLYDADAEDALFHIQATLSRSRNGLLEAVRQSKGAAGSKVLVVVDQFEELFRFNRASATSQEEAIGFVNLLLHATQQADQNVFVVLTMRSDYLGECSQFLGLAEAVNDGEFLIPRMTRDQIQQAIEGPIRVHGAEIAPRLLFRLLNDVQDNQDQLPVLQHALMRTWDSVAAEPAVQCGGHRPRALRGDRRHAPGPIAACRRNLRCLPFRPAPHCRGARFQGPHRARLRRTWHPAAHPPRSVGGDCRRGRAHHPSGHRGLSAPGVTFLMPPVSSALDNTAVIDISHESLMRVWAGLATGWRKRPNRCAFTAACTKRPVCTPRSTRIFTTIPICRLRFPGGRPARLNSAWADQYGGGFDEAMAFLAKSRDAAEREEKEREAARQRELERARQLTEAQQLRLEQQLQTARKLRLLIAGVAVVAVIAAIACVAALVARNEAGTLAIIADAQAEKARKNAEETVKALGIVESQKAEVEGSLSKAEAAEKLARAAEETGRKLLYTTDMRLAPFVWRDERVTAEQLRVLLAKHIPDRQAAIEKPDLRGFEWHYFEHLLKNGAAVFSGHAVALADGGFTSNGQIVTLDQGGQVRRWNLDTQDEDKARRLDLPGALAGALAPNGGLAALAEGDKVRVFDSSTGQETFHIDSAHVQYRMLIFSRDGERLVIVDNKIRWCDTASGQVIASVDQKFDWMTSLALSADGLTLAVVGHGQVSAYFSTFRLDAAGKTVTAQAKDAVFTATVTASALSPDGRLLAVGFRRSGAVWVHDAVTGRPIAAHASAHTSPVSALTFAGDGLKLVTADLGGTIKIWEDARKLTSKSAAAMTLKGHEGAITHVGLSSTGKQLVSTSVDKTARVWDMDRTGVAIRELERSVNCRFGARFSPDGLMIAAAAGSGVRLWDAATGKLVRELSAGDKGQVFSLAFSPTDSRLLAVGYGGKFNDSQVVLWDIDAATERARLPGVTDLPGYNLEADASAVGALAFSPDGKYLVAGFGLPTTFPNTHFPTPLKVWEVATGRLIHRLYGHTGYCVSLDFSRDGALLASGSRDGTAILWSTASWKATQRLQNPDLDRWYAGRQGMVEVVAFAPDGKTLAMASREGTVHLWDVATAKVLQSLKGHSSAVQAMTFSPDGRTLASGGVDQMVRLWNVQTRRELMQMDSGNVEVGQVQSLAFSPDGQHLLAAGGVNAFWSTAPELWNNPDRAAEKLRLLLHSNADFQSRIRMLSENLRLHSRARQARLERWASASRVGRRPGQLACLTPGVARGCPRV